MTKERQIYNLLKENKGEWVSILRLHNESNCMCVGAVCANLRKRGCIVDNKEIRQKTGLVFSYYKLIAGCKKYDEDQQI